MRESTPPQGEISPFLYLYAANLNKIFETARFYTHKNAATVENKHKKSRKHIKKMQLSERLPHPKAASLLIIPLFRISHPLVEDVTDRELDGIGRVEVCEVGISLAQHILAILLELE